MDEFSIISNFFNRQGLSAGPEHSHVKLGIGDDAALIKPDAGLLLAISMDTVNEGVHFPLEAPPEKLGYRALAVNLSDMAAMGAAPLGFTLSLSLPKADTEWLEAFSKGLSILAQRFNCPLLGGDLTRGGLSITIQVHGQVEPEAVLTRGNAKPGDLVVVSGSLGAAAGALDCLPSSSRGSSSFGGSYQKQLWEAFYTPRPRIDLGRALGTWATAAIDISDGLLADLNHIAGRSRVGIRIALQAIPVSPYLQGFPQDRQRELALSGGDDYELAFTVPSNARQDLARLAEQLECPLSIIGEVVTEAEVKHAVECFNADGEVVPNMNTGYRHF